MLVDVNARHHRRSVVLEPRVFYGQLQQIFVIRLRPSRELKLDHDTTLILAAIRSCADANPKGTNEVIPYYSQEGVLEIVDMSCVQCVVGRIKDGNEWAIIDRSHAAARPVFIDDSE